MRVIFQNEVAECGYACLAMVLTHFGRATEVRELSEYRPLSANGVRLSDLYDLATDYGLSVTAFQLEDGDVNKIRKGSIVHFGGSHFVVFDGYGRGHVRLIDPATGRRRLSIGAFLKNTSGYLIECAATPALPQIKARSNVLRAIRRVLGASAATRGQLLKICFVAIGTEFAVLSLPYFGSLVLDNVVAENNIDLLRVLTFTFSCIFAIGAFSQYIQRYLVAIVEQTLHGHAAEHLVAALLRRRASYFEKRHVGDIYARMNSLQEIVQYVSHKLVEFWISIVTGMLALSLMLVQSPLLAGVASGIFALYIAIACVLYPRMREAHQDQSEATARADDATIETIRAGTLIKLASRETAHTAHYMRHFKRVIEAKFRVDKLKNLRDAILKLVEYADTIIVAYVSVSLMLGGKVSVGVFYSFLIYKSLMAERLAQAISIGFEYFLLTVPVARIDDLIEHAAERYTPPEHRHKATEVETFERIDLSDARFSYGVSDRVVFERLSLRITRGDKIAIVGPSGVGKSTLFKLLTAMETPDAGRITLNGIDYATLAVDEVRQHMSNMRQGDIVLNGTMAENVSLLAAEPDERRIHELLGLVGLLDDVMKLPMRTRTIVSDALANISAGQRQRLLLARALYQDRELLLLDEPTSNLDDALAITIGRHLAGLRKTVVVITHDTALASLFESRYQLLDGALVKYDELLR